MTEREQSLESLQQRQVKTRDSLTRTARVVRTLGTPEIDNWLDLSQASDDFFVRADKVEEIKIRLNNRAVPTLQERLLEVSSQIKTIDTRVEEARANLQSVRERVEKGLLPPVALETARKIVDDLGFAIRPAVQAAEKEAGKKSNLTIDRENKTVLFGNKIIVFRGRTGNAEFRVLVHLARRQPKEIPNKQVREVAKRAGLRAKTNPIVGLRRLFEEDPSSPKIIVTSKGRGRGAFYRLDAQVKFVGESIHAKRSREGYEVHPIYLPDGQIIQVRGRLRFMFINALRKATSSKKAMQSDELALAVYGRKDDSARRLLPGLVTQSRKVLKGYNWSIRQDVEPQERARGLQGKYYLEKIEKEKEESLKEKPKVRVGPTDPQKLAALELFIDDPKATFDDVLKVFGEKDKRGRKLGRHHLVFGLTRIVNRLAFRKHAFPDDFTQEEERVLNKVSTFLGEIKIGSPTEDLKRFRKHAADHFEPRAAVGEKEIKISPEEIVSDEEALLLAVLIENRIDLLKKYGLEGVIPEENIKGLKEALMKRVNGKVSVTKERIEEIRQSAIKKVNHLARNYNRELVDRQSWEVQEVILFFMISDDASAVANYLGELLARQTEMISQFKHGQPVSKLWRDFVLDIEKTGKRKGVQKISEKHEEKPKKRAKALRQTERKARKSETKPKISAIEKSDPNVGRRLEKIVKSVDKLKLPWPLSNPQVTKFFPRLKSRRMNLAIENGYLKPQRGRDHHPRFKKEEIVLLLYLDQIGKSLNSRQLKDLIRLISRKASSQSSKKRK